MYGKRSRLLQIVGILRELGYELDSEARILDFGCGGTQLVEEMRCHGYQAFGCDIEFKDDKNVDTDNLRTRGIIRLIDDAHYKIPFADDYFDFVVSDQVFEHVQNYCESLSEIGRVLKKNGVALSIFPSRYSPIEPHVRVPLATVIQSYWWLHLWARFGIRNRFQNGWSAKRTADHNDRYLARHTNYLSKVAIKIHFLSYFNRVRFCEREFLKHSIRKGGKWAYTVSHVLPFIPWLYTTFRARVILAGEPKKLIQSDPESQVSGNNIGVNALVLGQEAVGKR